VAIVSRMRWFIYVLRDPISWDVRYVGKTVDPVARIKSHLKHTATKDHYAGRWIASVLRRGLEPMLEVIDAGIGTEHGAAERAWIADYRRNGARLTNTAPGGEGWFGSPPDVVREKISKTLTGRKQSDDTKAKRAASRAGFRHTDESKRKCRENNLGKKRSPETRARVSAALTGRPRTAETIEKWRSKVVGQKRPPETGAKIAATKIGKPRDPEMCMRIAEKLRGRRPTEETKAKLRTAQQARRRRERGEG
jgi:FtsZ-interacting cell division protein YlmF